MKIEIKRLKEGDNPRVKLFDSEEEKERMKADMQRFNDNFAALEVYPEEDGYHEIDQGHRRFACAKEMSWTEIECRVLPNLIPERERFIKRFKEDDNTKPYSKYERMLFMKKLKDKYNFSQKRIAKELNRSESWVSQNLSILNFSELTAFVENGGNFDKAVSLSRIENETDRIAILGSIDAYSTAQLREIVKDAKHIEVIKPPLESPTDALEGESRIADEVVKVEGHPSEGGRPILLSPQEDDGETGSETIPVKCEISPDGEPENVDGDSKHSQIEENAIPHPTTTDSSPSKPKIEKRSYCLDCGHTLGKSERTKDHECATANSFQGRLWMINTQIKNTIKKENGTVIIQREFKRQKLLPSDIPHIDGFFNAIDENYEDLKEGWKNERKKIEAS